MIVTCDRCKREIFKSENCSYCNRNICDRCIKSAQRVKKVTRLVICNDCWTDTAKRKLFKNKLTVSKSPEL